MPDMAMAVPPWLILVHGLHDAAALLLLGMLGFRCLVAPVGRRRAIRLVAFVALLTGAAWFLGEAASVAGATTLTAALAAIPAYLRYFLVARALLARAALLLLAGLLAPWPRLSLAMAALALATQPLLGHPWQAGWVPSLAEVAHVIAAGLWLGGLPPLLAALRVLPAAEHQGLVLRFSRLGYVVVAVIALTGPLQAFFLVGAWSRIWSTAYGHVLVVKTVLFALALVLAAENRFRFAPRLNPGRSGAERAGRALLATVAQEALVGLLLILAAAWLASLAPGM
jgi:putative copper export protein